MFASQAHSFTQQARLAITLAWVAGFTNTVSLLALSTVTSHMSGAASQLGLAIAERKWPLAGFEFYLLFTFTLGAVLAGVSMETGRRRGWESIYVLPVALEAGLLAGMALGLELYQQGAHAHGSARALLIALAAMSMGLQNATITKISSGVVRTTHVTGVVTDLGTELVQWLFAVRDAALNRSNAGAGLGAFLSSVRRHQSSRRVFLLGSIIASFALGAGLGALMYDHLPRWSMFPPVVFLLWIIYQDVRRPIADIELASVVDAQGIDVPRPIGVYAITKNPKLKGTPRMPDLHAWTDRLPEHVKIAVLDVRDVRVLDENDLAQLAAAVQRLHVQHRHLIVSGVSAGQFQTLRTLGVEDLINPESIVPDLEFALVRALVLHEQEQQRGSD